MNTRTPIAIMLTALVFAVPPAWGQVGKIFKDKDITEGALVDALTPEPTVRTRSIRVQPSSGAPAKAPAASVLITFETNSAELTPPSRLQLDVVGRALGSDRLADFSFSVEGHADPRGTSEHNLRLSQARAESVVEYLVQQHGIKRQRLNPIGKGDVELANAAVPAAPENRRVTIVTRIE
ncbi:MAG: OmpA family protein [Burkholderiaceae bacterium]|nr:OmpA family protein [Burkholderiaceae bacterium]